MKNERKKHVQIFVFFFTWQNLKRESFLKNFMRSWYAFSTCNNVQFSTTTQRDRDRDRDRVLQIEGEEHKNQ